MWVRELSAAAIAIAAVWSGLGPAMASSKHGHTHERPQPHRHADAGSEIETENLFGFTTGSDVEPAGARGVALETIGRSGKRDGVYFGLGTKLEFSYGLSDRVSVAFAALADHHDIRGVTDFDDTRITEFNGLGGELRWRLLERSSTSPGVTLHIEPTWQRVDELSGQRARKWASENKLILDAALVPDRLFSALNFLYEVEHVREHASGELERSSKLGIAGALSTRLAAQVFIGAEVRYLRAYEGLAADRFAGEALFIGPTLFAHPAHNVWLSAAWNVQVAGHEAGSAQSLDLVNFERHQFRLKAGVEF